LRRDEVAREWKKLHSEEMNDVYCSPNIVPVIKSIMGVTCSTYGEEERLI
jgi:hypothetical protein